jgi:decaprenylphospho-beta-D-ribofuranose 2-oxidase
MSVVDRADPGLRGTTGASPGRERRLSGWGRAGFSRAQLVAATSAEQIADTLAQPAARSAGVIARGAGRSYGDAAQNGGGTVLDLTGMRRVLAVDPQRRQVRVQAGVTYAQLLSDLVPQGLMLPVIPGTRHVTIGGAVASDVHGKNHVYDGSIAAHVAELTLCTPAGGLQRVAADADGELLLATLGGMGLTGVVVEATLDVEPLRSPWWSVDTDRTSSLAATLELMALDEGHRFSVAWLDLLASGTRLGQAVITRSNDWPSDLAPERRRGRGARTGEHPLLAPPRLRVPRGFPGRLLAPPAIAAFNELRWRSFPRRQRSRPTPLGPHFFPLDGFGDWNRLYGSGGLLQYQFAVPYAQEGTLVRCVELLRARRVPTYLAVLKRLGPRDGGLLSFPLQGWTLALDIPAWATGLRPALDQLDELVAAAGGRVYLTKDLRLRRDLLATMYPQLDRFEAERARVDPDGVMRSDLGRRLGLCGAAR